MSQGDTSLYFECLQQTKGQLNCLKVFMQKSREKIHYIAAAAAAKWLQSCPTLCDPIDGSPPGSSVSGILQARTLEWVVGSYVCSFFKVI